MQPAFSPVKQQIIDLHNLVLVIITLITLFVGGLLGWVMYRYNAKRNPVPTQTTHNPVLEVAWTVIPVLILVVMAIPSFRLVYYEDRTYDPDLTIKVTGHQWYWEYTYPDKGNIDFSSYIVPDDQLKPGQLRLLTADNPLVVPVGQEHPHPADQRRRDPQLLHPVARRAALCHPRPHHRDLDAGGQAGHLLWRVQPDLRHQPQPHADRGAGGDASRISRPGWCRRRRSSRRRAEPATAMRGRSPTAMIAWRRTIA